MSPKLLSFKRSFLLLSFFLALLVSAVYLQGRYEVEVPSGVGISLSSVWESFDSWISWIGSSFSRIGGSSSGDLWQNSSNPSKYASSGSVSFAPPSSSPPSLLLNFSSSVSTSLFRTWGTLTFQGGLSLPYLILNATLWDGDRLVESTRYMMIEVEPGRSRDFDICESCRLGPGISSGINYTCLLEVEEPKELFVSDWRDCVVAEDDPKVAIWEVNGVVSGQDEVPEKGSVDSPLPSASAKTVSSSSSKLTASSQDLEDSSDDTESEDEGRSSGPSSGDQRETETDVGKADYEDNQVGEVCYVGSTTSNKYHRPDCSYAKKIKPENRIYFSDVWEAREAGYLPCKACNPE